MTQISTILLIELTKAEKTTQSNLLFVQWESKPIQTITSIYVLVSLSMDQRFFKKIRDKHYFTA